MNSFYTPEELAALGLKAYGNNVKISRKASIYGAAHIAIGNNTRIDDFCILSGHITLGDYVHIAVHALLFGGAAGIVMEDFSGLSSRCAVYAESDDYSGDFLSNPTCPMKYRMPHQGRVVIGSHAVIGSGSTVLPSTRIGEGAAIGAMSLIIHDVPPWTICAGIPCRVIKRRSRRASELGEAVLQLTPGEP